MKRFKIECRETGDVIDTYETLSEAKKVLAKFETSDKKEGIYEANFYAIYDTIKKEQI